MAKRTREDTDGGACASSMNTLPQRQQLAASEASTGGLGSVGKDSKRPCNGKQQQQVERDPSTSTSTSTGWLRELWLCGVGFEQLLTGWYPFVQDDFVADYDDGYADILQPWDDWLFNNDDDILGQNKSIH